MFWESIGGGLGMLAHWQVWAGVVAYVMAFGAFQVLCGLIMLNDDRGRRSTIGCLLYAFGGALLQGVLVAVLIAWLLPLMIGTNEALSLGDLGTHALGLIGLGCACAVVATLLTFVPFIGELISGVPGLQTFVQGMIAYQVLTGPALRDALGENAASVTLPGFWACVGYFVIALILIYASILILGAVGVAARSKREPAQDEESAGPLMTAVGQAVGVMLGLLPLFMYASHVRLAIQYSGMAEQQAARYASGCGTESTSVEEFRLSIEASNQAATLSNAQTPFSEHTPDQMRPIFSKYEEALAHAERVRSADLERHFAGWGSEFDRHYVPGLRLVVDSQRSRDNSKQIRGMALLDQWGAWYDRNIAAIRGAR